MTLSKLLPLLVFALVLVASAAVQPAAAAEAPALGCGLDLAAIAQPTVEALASSAITPNVGVAPAVPEPGFLARFSGYCRCGCSTRKNCNTSADCGGSACLGGISCC